MSATTFIYCLCEPGTRTVRYVGKSNNPSKRLTGHIDAAKQGSQTHVSRWIRQLSARPELFVIGEIPLLGWQNYERNVIAAARALSMTLTNITDGGEGGGPTGYRHTPEAKMRIAKASKERKRSPEALARLSASKIGKKLRHNTSGFVGVTRMKYGWHSRLSGVYLGHFKEIEDAVFVRALTAATL